LICHRNFGVGSDGILLRSSSTRADFGLRILNPDGSEAEKSGNGVRIFAKYLYDLGHASGDRFSIDTLGGVVHVRVVEQRDGQARVIAADMGRATIGDRASLDLDGERLDVTTVSVGNPHCVIFGRPLTEAELRRLGPRVENHLAFPDRTNVQLAQVVDRRSVEILIWERGAGETLASGSSSCAVAAACHHRGLVDRSVTLRMPGGELAIELRADGEIEMTGPVEEVCRGTFAADLRARLEALG
jgi:diaminopimelate epimerase